eukprot:12557843-Alexandrium_andersonii.AAC.1
MAATVPRRAARRLHGSAHGHAANGPGAEHALQQEALEGSCLPPVRLLCNGHPRTCTVAAICAS